MPEIGAAEGIGKRKCALEEVRGATGHGHRRVQGQQSKKLVSPARKRRAVHYLSDERSYLGEERLPVGRQPARTISLA